VRHAAATHVGIVVERIQDASGDMVRVTVQDDGRGLAPGSTRDFARYGLMGMRERVQALDGELNIESRPGQGVTVCAFIPVTVRKNANNGEEAA
jgi:signal transduction histidine kinase